MGSGLFGLRSVGSPLLGILLLFSALVLSAPLVRAQELSEAKIRENQKRIDAVTFSNLRPGGGLSDLSNWKDTHIDTVFFSSDDGANMFLFRGPFCGYLGDIRVTTEAGKISQVNFAPILKSKEEAEIVYHKLQIALTKKYGEPADTYDNVIHIIRWMGLSEMIVLTFKDYSGVISVALSKPVKKESRN
ncbi:MAG: hypothetical protein ABI444_02205 [Candidatus Kapaibacterium sp.]